jgi:hypothetical protein
MSEGAGSVENDIDCTQRISLMQISAKEVGRRRICASLHQAQIPGSCSLVLLQGAIIARPVDYTRWLRKCDI